MQEKRKVGVGVGIMIVKDGKVLLGKRHETLEKAQSSLKGAGTWAMPGGHLDFGETFEECARREVMEETGMQLPTVQVVCVNNDKIESAHFITVGLFCDDSVGEPQVLEPNEITEWKWFDLDVLPSPLYFPSERILENYAKKSFYISR